MADSNTTRDQALRVARMLGCQGAHEHPNGWMPCASHEEYEAIKKGTEEYLKVRASKKKKPLPKMVQRTKRLETKSDAYYENRADAVAISKARGCGGVRTILLAGKKYYAVCNHKAPKRGWENLDEKPISGIATLPGGGLVTGSFSGKSVEEKGFVNFVSRSTDPDTFSDPESARIRSRNLGCIGIRRYTARDGKLVWLPCTNVSDYNRVTGIRGDNSPRNNPRRQGAGFKKKTLGNPIGGVSDIDGDGDGMVTGPGGKDNIPAPLRSISLDQLKPEAVATHRRFLEYQGWDFAQKEWNRIYAIAKRKKGDTVEQMGDIGPALLAMTPEQRRAESKLRRRAYDEKDWQRLALAAFHKKHGIFWEALEDLHAKEPDLGKTPIRDFTKKKPKTRWVGKSAGGGIVSFKGVPKPKKKPPTVTSGDINDLAVRVRNNNSKAKTTAKTNLRDLKIVFLRGLEDGSKETAKKRVYKFLALLNSDKPADVKYFDDNDLLPLDHPWRNRKTSKKWAGFREGEYGVKYSKGCCPRVVKRHYSNTLIL